MPIQLTYDDLTAKLPAGEDGGVSQSEGQAAPGGTVLNWLEQAKSLLQVVNEIIMNYKDIRSNISPQQPAPLPFQGAPAMHYVAPPADLPAAPAAAAIDINAVMIDKARQIIVQLQKAGFGEASIEDVYNSFKSITVKQLAAMLEVPDDTGPEK